MSLTLSLNNALSGINVAQRSLAVLANNVANANTIGYHRQVAELSPRITGTQGSGAAVEDIVRKIDQYLVESVRNATSAAGASEVEADYMERLQIMLGQPGGDNSIDEYIENFFNTMQALAESPELTSFRYEAVNSGLILARELSTLASGLEGLRYQADQDIQDTVDLINSEILRLDETNLALHRAVSLGDPVANLLDRRDQTLATLSQYLDIRVNENDRGQVQVYTNGGIPLLEDVPYQLIYSGAGSLDTFTGDGSLSPILVDAINENGSFVGRPVELVSSGVDTDITTSLEGGDLKGLLNIRDQEIPKILQQLDLIASQLRDQFNVIHNAGSGLPAASTLSGTRPTTLSSTATEWTGTVRIAALNTDGSAVTSRYGHTDAGYLPLDLNFDALQSNQGDYITTEAIMREINEHFRPHNKAVIGNMNDIRLAAISDVIPDGTNFTFDLELENISDSNSNMWVSGVTVLDDTAANITAVTTTYPAPLALDALNTFTANPPDDLVTVRSTGHGLSEGDVVYMNGVTGPFVDNIPVGDINGQAFRIVNVTANTFDIEVVGSGAVTTGAAVNETGNAQQSYATQGAGTKGRTGSNGDITLDLSGNLASSFYTVQLDVMVEDDNGNLTSSTISYRVENGATNNMNNRYDARLVAPSGANPGGALEAPTTTRAILRAELVNEEGIAVGPGEEGYLRIVGQEDPFNPESYYSVAIDDSSSREIGRPNLTPPEVGSNWGFSHYFGLNDFFVANEHTTTGDTVAGSALNMVVRQDIIDNPNLISMGTLTSTPDPVTGYPNYSVERTIGDNSVAQRLSGLGISQVTFDSAGGLPQTTKTFNGYASEILGYLSSKTASAVARSEDDQILLDGFTERMDAISGVNIDEEMANTIIFQNAYNASAQVIRTVKELFDTLLASF